MATTPTYKKLRLHTARTALILNSAEDFGSLIGELPEGIEFVSESETGVDFVQLFVKSSKDLDSLIEIALRAIKYDGLLWVCYPKGSSKVETDLNRDIIWERLKGRGIRPVMMISINETWSAMRLRPEDAVGK